MSAERVLLVNLGTTEAPTEEAVRRFLREFLSDPRVVDYPGWLWRPILSRILRSRPKRIAEQYEAIWTRDGSPLAVGTRRMTEALREVLHADVDFAYRYGSPSLAEALASGANMRVVPLFPQRTGSTTGTIEALVAPHAERVSIGRVPPDAPGYIEALAERWASPRDAEHLIVSFHGIPLRYDRAEGGIYHRDCETTYRALLAELDWPPERATLAFQSRFGPEPWIGPRTASVLRKLPRSGASRVTVMTPGFLTEGLETVEEIGIRGRRTFEKAGGERLELIPTVSDHPAFIRALAEAACSEEGR